MRLSIITPSFNQGMFIEQTIRSVLAQDHDDIEHLVMDGGSTDNTREILARHPHLNWVSQKDRGQSDAINKGFQKATGEIVAWLNSDDFYQPNVLGAVARYFAAHPDCMVLYGDITFVDKDGKTLYGFSGDTINFKSLTECPDIVRQPSFFWRKKLVEEQGGVDESLVLVMDFDFFLRAARKWQFHYLPMTISSYRFYDENKSRSMGRLQAREIFAVYRKNKVRLTPRILRFLAVKYALSFDWIRKVHGVIRGTGKRAGGV